MTSEARETSGVTTGLLVRYLRAEGGERAVARTLALAQVDLSAHELERTTSRVDHRTVIRLFEAATEVMGDPRTMYRVGASALAQGGHHPVVRLMRAAGSPRRVMQQMPRAVATYTAGATLELLEHTATSARLRYRHHEGVEHSPHDCDFTQGLLTGIPAVFGLPPAQVEHAECQADGSSACVYDVSWARPRARWLRRPDEHGTQAEAHALRGQLEELTLAASDLVSSDDAVTVLQRLVDRASATLLAPGHLLVVEGREGAEPLVLSAGLSPGTVRELAGRLGRGEDLGPAAVVADVASSRGRHGRFAVLHTAPHEGMEADRGLVEAYARHVAAALDVLSALDVSRREASRAAALLDLAHGLATVSEADAVADVLVAAVPGIVGCTRATVMLWDPARGVLRTRATVGMGESHVAALMATDLRPDGAPEVAAMLARRDPAILEQGAVSPELETLFAATGSVSVIAVPLVAGETFMGVVTASWEHQVDPVARDQAVVRITGVADHGSIALQNARLLATVRHQSMHDALTGLPNRVLFTQELDDALRAAGPDAGTAILFCDLDRFKTVNDRLGHAAGDELLRQAAARLRTELRPQDAIGRLGGDEFAVRVTDVDEQAAVAVAMRLVEALDQPFRIDGTDVRITVSVGVAVHHGPDGRGARMLAAADAAMYEAKERGRDQVAVAGEVAGRLVVPSLEAELGRAAQSGQLRLFYQPVVDVSAPASGRSGVVGAEALLRWAHPRLGLLAPAAFLPLAEESGLVTGLDLWAITAACSAMASWPDGENSPLRVAVNLASATLLDERLLPTVRAALKDNGLAAERLHLEVVESRSLVDLPGVIERLVELRRLGIRISLDDFGTGYSTLTWLQSLPVDQIKIDRSFIMHLPGDGASVAVVRGVMALARELGIEVIAEGVEEPEQLALLEELGCEMVQGYLLGRPRPALDMAATERLAELRG